MNHDASTKNQPQPSARKVAMNGFPGDTFVRTLGGFKCGYEATNDYACCIENIEVGDYVLTRCKQTGEIDYKRVTRVFNGGSMEIMEVHFINHRPDQEKLPPPGGLLATANHPFWVQGKGWVAVRDLRAGDEFLTYDSSRVACDGVAHYEYGEMVFNFEVEDFHTYFVHELGMWVRDQVA